MVAVFEFFILIVCIAIAATVVVKAIHILNKTKKG